MTRLLPASLLLAWAVSWAGAAQMTLSLERTALGEWQLLGQLSNNADNDGLSSLIVDVEANGGDIGVATSACELPYGTHYWLDGGTMSQGVGFTEFRSDGSAGIGIRAGQKTTALDQVVLTDVGYTGGTYPGDETGGGLGATEITWTAPVVIASGTYSGLWGTLTADVGAGQVNVLDQGRDPNQAGGVHQVESVSAAVFRVLHPGDATGDDSIDGGDLAIMGGNWMNTSGTLVWADGDFNFDGSVDGGDLAIMGGYWFWSAPSSPPPPAAAIPEPATISLLCLGGAAALLRPKRTARR